MYFHKNRTKSSALIFLQHLGYKVHLGHMAIKTSPIQTLGKMNTDTIPILFEGLAAGKRNEF